MAVFMFHTRTHTHTHTRAHTHTLTSVWHVQRHGHNMWR